jgi:hypothetical protein
MPATHAVVPVETHTPTPQLVAAGPKSSSTTPLQSSSMALQTLSLEAALPGVHELTTCPCVQLVVPDAAQAPAPQVIVVDTNASSVRLSQSSSMLLQEASLDPGKPAPQESMITPRRQLVAPVLAQAPTPQLVACPENSSSNTPSQSSSTPLQVSSCAAGCPA